MFNGIKYGITEIRKVSVKKVFNGKIELANELRNIF